jgi:hypothetical protein
MILPIRGKRAVVHFCHMHIGQIEDAGFDST